MKIKQVKTLEEIKAGDLIMSVTRGINKYIFRISPDFKWDEEIRLVDNHTNIIRIENWNGMLASELRLNTLFKIDETNTN